MTTPPRRTPPCAGRPRRHDIRVAGGVVALGSDWPIAPCDPRWIMADAQLRRRFARPEMEPIRPEPPRSHRAGVRRRLTVFGAGPLTVDPEELGRIEVRGTVAAGEPVRS